MGYIGDMGDKGGIGASKIINTGIFAHVDAGKTTFTEQLLFASGAIRKVGSVDCGTAQTDWLPIERERGISVRSAQTSFFHNGKLINLIDTPGHVDFAGEAERVLFALDAAVLLISAPDGVQSHTETLWNALSRLKIPTLIVLNKTDLAGSDTQSVVNGLPGYLGSKDKLFLRLDRTEGEGGNDVRSYPLPLTDESVIEALAEMDDGIGEAYVNGEEITEATVAASLRRLISEARVIPVISTCARNGIGITGALDVLTELMPTAAKKEKAELSAYVFKIEHDKTMGKMAFVRMFGGELSARDPVRLTPGEPEEKISQIRKFSGQKYADIGKVTSGDIAALCGLQNAKVFDVLGNCRVPDEYRIADPFLSVRATSAVPGEFTRLAAALKELAEEEPLLRYRWDKTEGYALLSVTGKIQIEILYAMIKERYGIEARFSEPEVIYRETPAKSGYGFDAYTMPKPCWAVVKLYFEPLPRGAGVVYDGGNVPSNTCFYHYQEHIRRSFFSSLEQGPRGWEVTDFKARLEYAEHHTIHTHPLDFFVCTPMAVMNGLKNTGTKLLEPYSKVRINAPSEVLGKVIGDVTAMRGEFETPITRGDSFTLEALLPVATSMEYPIRLSSLTHGKGVVFSSFAGYRDCPEGLGKTAARRGPDPLDRSKWILYARGAMRES